MTCPACKGSGLVNCARCNGRGCSGFGNSGKVQCPNCKGKGSK